MFNAGTLIASKYSRISSMVCGRSHEAAFGYRQGRVKLISHAIAIIPPFDDNHDNVYWTTFE